MRAPPYHRRHEQRLVYRGYHRLGWFIYCTYRWPCFAMDSREGPQRVCLYGYSPSKPQARPTNAVPDLRSCVTRHTPQRHSRTIEEEAKRYNLWLEFNEWQETRRRDA
jgi:hypothetical protein